MDLPIRGRSSPNLNGFIVSLANNGGCGEIFHRNDHEVGVWNYPHAGPWFGNDLYITSNCHRIELFYSTLGGSYGRGPGLNQYALFGQKWFRMADYEVFKILID
jgi:hypothetical protein